ncbi:MAG: hypothetical protein OEM63_01720 [Gammaproteobacteria bacterium]|nr:hypothetical protein [Gammaproteobacteria bacterium]
MNPTVRNIVAVVVGFVVGSAFNLGIVMVGPSIIPPPAGVDVTDAASIADSMHLFEPKHFITPFLAHAVGTFAGAVVALRISASEKPTAAWIIGGLFLAGGIYASTVIPAPTWFMALDIVGAYIPMAWLAIRLAGKPAQAE